MTQQLATPLVAAQVDAIRVRRDHVAFAGDFTSELAGTTGRMAWVNGEARVELTFDVAAGTFQFVATDASGVTFELSEAAVA